MIQGSRHKGLKRLYEKGDARGVPPEMLAKVSVILADLDAAETPEDLSLPGYGLHARKGDLKGYWSVKVTGNWRIVFRMEDGNVYRVDLTDYH